MVTVGVVGLVSSLLATVVAFVLLGRVERSLDESLSVTEDAVAAFEETVVVADQLVSDVNAGLGSARDALAAVRDSLEPSADALEEGAGVLDELPTRLAQIDRGLGLLVAPAKTLDRALAALPDLGAGFTYDADTGLGRQLEDLSKVLDGLPSDVRTVSESLSEVSNATRQLNDELERVLVDVDAVRERLEVSDSLVDRYRQTAAEAGTVATDTRSGLSRDILWMRVLVVFVGLSVAAGQVVPLWTGSGLLVRAARRDEAERDRRSGGSDGSGGESSEPEREISPRRHPGGPAAP